MPTIEHQSKSPTPADSHPKSAEFLMGRRLFLTGTGFGLLGFASLAFLDSKLNLAKRLVDPNPQLNQDALSPNPNGEPNPPRQPGGKKALAKERPASPEVKPGGPLYLERWVTRGFKVGDHKFHPGAYVRFTIEVDGYRSIDETNTPVNWTITVQSMPITNENELDFAVIDCTMADFAGTIATLHTYTSQESPEGVTKQIDQNQQYLQTDWPQPVNILELGRYPLRLNVHGREIVKQELTQVGRAERLWFGPIKKEIEVRQVYLAGPQYPWRFSSSTHPYRVKVEYILTVYKPDGSQKKSQLKTSVVTLPLADLIIDDSRYYISQPESDGS